MITTNIQKSPAKVKHVDSVKGIATWNTWVCLQTAPQK